MITDMTNSKIRRTRRRTAALALAATLSTTASLFSASAALATEGGNQHYPIGANTAQPAIMPDPGNTSWLNYNQFYTANAFVNGQGVSSVAGYHVNTFAEAARIIHSWDLDLGGWILSSQVILTAVHTDLWRGGAHHGYTGFGDLNIVPIYLSRNFGDFYLLAGINVWAPTGDYSKSRIVNSGMNYSTFAPEFAITYRPNDKLLINLDMLAMFNTENPATHYLSGNSINFDYSAGYRPFDEFQALQLGISGYYFAQWTDDIQNSVTVANGNRGRVFAIGPQIRYDFPFKYPTGGIIFKWQKELAVMNRPEGNRFWCQFALKF